MSSVAVVTGGNKGIGLAIVKKLLLSEKFTHVYLTSRNVELGNKAISSIKENTKSILRYHQLDLTDLNSINVFSNYIKCEYGFLTALSMFYRILNFFF